MSFSKEELEALLWCIGYCWEDAKNSKYGHVLYLLQEKLYAVLVQASKLEVNRGKK